MSSTDLDALPLKSILIAIAVVLGLHVLTAVALVAMKPSTPKASLIKQTPPIEIELVSLPAALPKETVKETAKVAKPIEKETTKVAEKTPSIPESQPAAKSKPKPVTEMPKKSVLQKQQSEVVPPVKVEKSERTTDELPTKKSIQQEKQHPNIDKAISEQQAKNQQAEQRRLVAAQAEKAAQEAANQAGALQEDIQRANAKAARDAQAQADAKAEKEAAQKAAMAAQQAAEAAARAKEAAASNEPVNFTASNANWAAAPNFSFPERAARRARSGDSLNVVLVLRVNKQGGIDSVRIAQSSGNAALDKEAARQVRSGKFKPFMKNGAPVVGNVTLPVAYNVP